jgi:hypothetical protein
MLDPNATGALRIAAGGNLILMVAGIELTVELTADELRHMAVALAVAADELEGKQPPSEALAILEPVQGVA